MRTFAAALALSALLSAQTGTAPPAKHKPKLMLEVLYEYVDDVGADEHGVLTRVFDSGAVEYTNHGKPQQLLHGTVGKGTIAQLGAILNSPAARALKPQYPAWQSFGFSAITYNIRFFSGSVERKIETANVFPIEKGHRDEYPTALLEVMCATLDIRDAVEAPTAFFGKRGDCDEFPRIAPPAKPVPAAAQ